MKSLIVRVSVPAGTLRGVIVGVVVLLVSVALAVWGEDAIVPIYQAIVVLAGPVFVLLVWAEDPVATRLWRWMKSLTGE